MEHRKPVIMVLDDNKEYLHSVKSLLGRQLPEFDVITFTDAFRAVVQVESLNPDILIIDMLLDRFDGIKILRTMRRKGITAPAIILSGYGVEAISKRICPENHISKIIDKTQMSELLVSAILDAHHSSESAMAE